jgi:hypothetical protein
MKIEAIFGERKIGNENNFVLKWTEVEKNEMFLYDDTDNETEN